MLATLGSVASQSSVPNIININQTIPINCSFGDSLYSTGIVSASGSITIVSYAPKTGQIVTTETCIYLMSIGIEMMVGGTL